VPLSNFINRPCTIITRSESGATDIYGDPERDEGSVQTVCELQPRSATEPANAGDLSSEDWTGYFLPADASSLDSSSAVYVEGLGEFELVGKSQSWRNSRTQLDEYVKAHLRRTAGPGEGGS
jgi:hypothetical protein